MQRVMISILFAFLLAGCAGEEQKPKSATPVIEPKLNTIPETKQQEPKMITVRGTVRYKTIEGGFWGLDADDGKKYMPSGLDKSLKVDGMVIEVKGIIEEDVITFQQYGRTLKIKESKMIDDSNARSLNSY